MYRSTTNERVDHPVVTGTIAKPELMDGSANAGHGT